MVLEAMSYTMFYRQETDQPKYGTTCGVGASFSSYPGWRPK
jgi:hypothetical protein